MAAVRLGSKADIIPSLGHVRFADESGHCSAPLTCPPSADFVAEVAEEGGPLCVGVEHEP